MSHCQLALIALLGTFQSQAPRLPPLRDGDIIFHTSRSSQSLAIQRATGSRYSHMGMIVYRSGRPYVLEAVATVRYTPLAQWIQRGSGSHFVVKRLRDTTTLLQPTARLHLLKAGAAFIGRPYDRVFEWSDDRVYCSELVWKAYERGLGLQIGKRKHMREFNLADSLVRTQLRQRYGNHIPLDEPVVSPQDMFESTLLVTVLQR